VNVGGKKETSVILFGQTSFFITRYLLRILSAFALRGKSSTCSRYERPPITWPLDVMRVASAVHFYISADNLKFPVMHRFGSSRLVFIHENKVPRKIFGPNRG
jgi:hypothetical protein